jgi:hypothetical protein
MLTGKRGVTVTDLVNHPPHYTSHPSGVECVRITEHLGFLAGSAIKYLWRADEKGSPVQDLEKARWYVQREISTLASGGRIGLSAFSYYVAWELTCKWVAAEPPSYRRDAVVAILKSHSEFGADAVAMLDHATLLITAEIELRA